MNTINTQEIMNLKIEAINFACSNRFDDALQNLYLVAKHCPNDFENWLNIGKLYHFKGQLLDAIKALQKACDLNPLSVDANNELGKVFLQISMDEEAQIYFLKAHQLSDEDVETSLYLGQIWLGSGKIEQAYNLFATAIDKFGDNPQLNNRFAIANQYFKKLPDAIYYHRKALELLINLPSRTMPMLEKKSFDNKKFETLLFQTLALLHNGGYKAFACSGTLLGLIRENRLLPNDKDIDIGVPFEELDEIVAYLSKFGWYEYKNSYELINPRAMKHRDSGLMLDLCGHKKEESGKTIAGFWMSDIQFEDNRITEYDDFSLCELQTAYGTVWSIKNPQNYLKSLYGDWQRPDGEFDTIIMANNLRSFSPLTICYALDRLFGAIDKQNFKQANRIVDHCIKHSPNDSLYLIIKHYLGNK